MLDFPTQMLLGDSAQTAVKSLRRMLRIASLWKPLTRSIKGSNFLFAYLTMILGVVGKYQRSETTWTWT